jgi:DNA-binding MarR family transcriptional regulator
MTSMTRQASATTADLASVLRPSLLRLTRILRNQRADTSVTLTHLSALVTLTKGGPMTAGDLAASERVQPPSMTKVLATLEQRGLVRREPHPSDRRSAIIAITDAGRELLDSERQRRDAWLTQRLAQLSVDERALLRSVIPILDKLAEAE